MLSLKDLWMSWVVWYIQWDQTICKVVAGFQEIKNNWKIIKLALQKVVAVAYERVKLQGFDQENVAVFGPVVAYGK